MGRRSVVITGTFVRRRRHATGQHDVPVRLNRRRRCHRRRGDVRRPRRRNRDRPERVGRRRLTTLQARRGAGRSAGAEDAAQHQILPPGIELPAAEAVPARHHPGGCARLHTLGHNPALLLSRPTTAALAAAGRLAAASVTAHMTSRRSAPCRQTPVNHHAVLRQPPHLAKNTQRNATWWPGHAYLSTRRTTDAAADNPRPRRPIFSPRRGRDDSNVPLPPPQNTCWEKSDSMRRSL